MSQFVLCRVCLAHNIKTYPLNKTRYQEIYEKYTGNKLIPGDGKLDKVCYNCNTLLLRFHKFLQMSQKAEEHLTELYQNGIELTASNVSSLATKMAEFSMTTLSSELTEVTDLSVTSPTTESAPVIQVITEPTVDSTVQDVAVKIESVDEEEYLAEMNNHVGVVIESYHVDVEVVEHMNVENNYHVDVEHSNVENNYHGDVEHSNVEHNYHVDVGHSNVEHNYHVDVENLNVDENNYHVDVENLNVVVENYYHEDLNHVDDSNLVEKVPFDIQPITEIEIEIPKKPEIQISDLRVTLERIEMPKLRSKKRGHHCPSCPRRFRSAALLRRHKCQQALAPNYLQELRHGPAQYHCKLCDRQFKHKSMFQVHHRTHTGEKPYECKFCDRTFNDKSNCRKHMKTHKTHKHACFMCDRSFSQRKLLVKHSIEHIL